MQLQEIVFGCDGERIRLVIIRIGVIRLYIEKDDDVETFWVPIDAPDPKTDCVTSWTDGIWCLLLDKGLVKEEDVQSKTQLHKILELMA